MVLASLAGTKAPRLRHPLAPVVSAILTGEKVPIWRFGGNPLCSQARHQGRTIYAPQIPVPNRF